MAKIHINFAGVDSANQILRKAVRELSQMEYELTALCVNVDLDIQSRNEIQTKLKACQFSAENIHEKADKLFSIAEKGRHMYRKTEAMLCRIVPDNDKV